MGRPGSRRLGQRADASRGNPDLADGGEERLRVFRPKDQFWRSEFATDPHRQLDQESSPLCRGGEEVPAEPPEFAGGEQQPAAEIRARPYLSQVEGCRTIESYDRLNMIDRGAYGVVSRARSRDTGEVVAVKRVLMDNSPVGFPVTSLREVNILHKNRHPNIVRLIEIVQGDSIDDIYMVMEFMDHELRMLMNSMKTPFQQAEVKCLLRQLLLGLQAMHDNWVIHRDLKTSNLLYNNRGVLKICDFGLARSYSGAEQCPLTPGVVTLYYRPPELLLGATVYSTAVDIWGVGCIFAEMLTNEILLPGKGELDQLYQIFRVVGSPTDEDWPEVKLLPHFRRFTWRHCPPGLLRQKFPRTTFSSGSYLSDKGYDLLSRMLALNPAKRISVQEALEHPYFSEAPRPQDPALMPTFPSLNEGSRELLRGKNAYEIAATQDAAAAVTMGGSRHELAAPADDDDEMNGGGGGGEEEGSFRSHSTHPEAGFFLQ